MDYEDLIARAEKPMFFGKIDGFSSTDSNPLCGDKITMYLKIKDDVLKDAKFEGVGCVISQTSADLLIEKCLNMSIDEIMKLNEQDIQEMLGLTLGPNRIKCAMLPLKVLKLGIIEYKKNKK